MPHCFKWMHLCFCVKQLCHNCDTDECWTNNNILPCKWSVSLPPSETSPVISLFFFTNNNLVHVCFHVLTFGNVRHSTHLLYSTWVLQSQDNYLRSSGTFIKLSLSRHTGFWVCSSVMNVRLSLDNRKKSLSFHFCDLTGASLQKAAEVLHSKWFFFRQLVSLCRHINDGRSVTGTI